MSVLAGQIAVVTGASGGIGAAITRVLAGERVRLCLVGRDQGMLDALADNAREYSEGVSTHQADLAVDHDVHRLVMDVQSEHGAADILIHAAGVISVGEIAQASIHEFDRQYRVNVRAAYLVTQGFLPMLRARCGQIVFINSSVGLLAKRDVGQYSATKHALKAFADSLRQEVNADGVRVTTVYPGQTASQMQELLHRIAGEAYAPEALMQPADVAAVVLCALSLPRTAEVTDIAVRPMQNVRRT